VAADEIDQRLAGLVAQRDGRGIGRMDEKQSLDGSASLRSSSGGYCHVGSPAGLRPVARTSTTSNRYLSSTGISTYGGKMGTITAIFAPGGKSSFAAEEHLAARGFRMALHEIIKTPGDPVRVRHAGEIALLPNAPRLLQGKLAETPKRVSRSCRNPVGVAAPSVEHRPGALLFVAPRERQKLMPQLEGALLFVGSLHRAARSRIVRKAKRLRLTVRSIHRHPPRPVP